ncbi:circadian clock-controlled protein daywake-like [Polyergus mexicanus]|uniref:circadian clock-controlled protein daywake-like n=1 Tax=Polyergus mexicanus TaxID=615972 RepID=UPI0038B5494E
MMVLAKATIFAILFIVATINAEAVRDIPEFLHICQTRDPQYETCVSNSINDLKPYLKVGVPEYNIPSMEPLILKKLSISPSNSLRVKMTDVNVYGASSFEVTKMKINFDKLFLVLDVILPNIFIEGKYDIDGKILLLPISGSGPMNGNFSNGIGIAKIQAERYIDENGIERVRIVDFKLKISVSKGSVKLDNLFNGEQILGDLINSSINNNFDLFAKEFLPMVEMTLSDAFQNISNNIIQQFSFTQLFPGL